jgi:hypothetical protein
MQRQTLKTIQLLVLSAVLLGCQQSDEKGHVASDNDSFETEYSQQWSIPEDVEPLLGFTSPEESLEPSEDIEESPLR